MFLNFKTPESMKWVLALAPHMLPWCSAIYQEWVYAFNHNHPVSLKLLFANPRSNPWRLITELHLTSYWAWNITWMIEKNNGRGPSWNKRGRAGLRRRNIYTSKDCRQQMLYVSKLYLTCHLLILPFNYSLQLVWKDLPSIVGFLLLN